MLIYLLAVGVALSAFLLVFGVMTVVMNGLCAVRDEFRLYRQAQLSAVIVARRLS